MLKFMLSESPIGLGMLIVQDFNLLETIICKIDSSAFNSPTNISFLKTASPIFSILSAGDIGKLDEEPRVATGFLKESTQSEKKFISVTFCV